MSNENYRLKKQVERSMPWLAIPLIAFLVLAMLALLTLRWLKGPLNNARLEPYDFTQSSEQVTPAQDTVFIVDNFTVVISRDATTLPGTLSITPREPNIFFSAGAAEWMRPLVVSVDYLDASGVIQQGMKFNRPILICFKQTPEQWADYTARPTEYVVQYYAEQKNPPVWEDLPTTAHPENNFLCGQTDHLSTFALAVKLTALVPITGITLTPTPYSQADELPPAVQPNTGSNPSAPDPVQPAPSPDPPTSAPPAIEPTNAPAEEPTEPPAERPTRDPPGRPTHKPHP